MRLQLLELSGFKSFPNRSEISFDHGVTAIVGPNGCGKSNLVDAITWVLGEQSAKSLRGDRMDDVIFGGSDGRRPTSAAEVRLVLKDVCLDVGGNGAGAPSNGNGHGGNGHGSDGQPTDAVEDDEEPLRRPVPRDIELARRLYRSGESEYLIDGHVSRLRDVQDLLMSAGVGVKGYAVIEQGKIGQILSARPNDRRQLIEEAAGVTKFKSRRHAAELKLEAARQNLSRIDDIIYEIEKQRGALKRQSAKARRYQRLRDELQRWEKVLIVRRHHELAGALTLILGQLGEAQAEEASAQSNLSGVEATLEQLRAELAARESGATAARDDAHALELDVRRVQQQIEFDRQQVEVLVGAAAEIGAEVERLEGRREPQQRDLFERREAATRADHDRAEAQRTFEENNDTHAAAMRDLEGLEADVEATRSEVFAAINAATALRHAVEHATAGHERVTADLSRIDLEAGDLHVERERTSAARTEAERLMAEGRADLERTIASRAERQTGLTEARTDRDTRLLELRELEQRTAATRARLSSLKELSAARAGYGDAARLVLSESNGTVDHRGSVADFLEVDRRYERAVEGALGDLLEYVIVPSHEHAAAALELVYERGAGRCGFLVLGEASAADAPADIHPDTVVPLSSVVRVTGEPADAIRQAMGAVWIADSFAAAVEAARGTTTPVVTRDGELVRGRHLVRGTGKGPHRGILSTKGEIRELDQRLVDEERSAAEAHESLHTLQQAIDDSEIAVATLTADVHEKEKLIVAMELRVEAANEAIGRLAQKQTLIDTDRTRANESRAALQARQTEAQESIGRLDLEQRLADERFSDAQRRLVDARASAEALGRAVAEAQASHARLVERSTATSADVARFETAFQELEERIRGRADELEHTRARILDLERSVAENERLVHVDRDALGHLVEVVQRADQRVTSLQNECHDKGHTLRDARIALDEARALVGGLEVNRATAEADIAHLEDSCRTTLQASLDEVVADVARMEAEGHIAPDVAVIREPDDLEGEQVSNEAEADDIERSESGEHPESVELAEPAKPATLTAEDAVVELRAKIERLGPINMMAIEQFDELETRHTFLTGQHKDLVDSIAATGEAIRRIERTTRERFKTAFDTINGYFETTFTTIFGGGKAGLVLLDEDDLLESGIDIIAQPPGKRLQSVQLLSGGEKALTAIALMFAIFRYRPSPFCLLDEIDAPLDDANIGRFVEMLRGMQDHTQFILITHNRRTMEIADRLYGVTMEEPGVSKLVSVNLN